MNDLTTQLNQMNNSLLGEPIKDRFKEIDDDIKTGRFDRCYKGTTYNKCNLFLNDTAKRFGIDIPKNKDLPDFLLQGNISSSGGVLSEHLDKPMTAGWLDDYYENRSALSNSGVSRVGIDEGQKLANDKNLVMVLGSGHASLLAPSKTGMPTIYRSDRSFRGKDKRIKVGIKNVDKFKYFYINPDQYNIFNEVIAQKGISNKDISSKSDLYLDLIDKE